MAPGTIINVPILPINQAVPNKTAGPIGRLLTCQNGIVRKYIGKDGQAGIRIEKRAALTKFLTTVRDNTTGSVTGLPQMINPTAMGTLNNRLVVFANAAAFVFSTGAGCWETNTYECPTHTLRAAPIPINTNFSSSVLTSPVQSARIGTRTMHVWSDFGVGALATLIDDDGTVLRAPFFPVATGGIGDEVKVVADGTRFWIVARNTLFNVINVTVYDAVGALLGTDASQADGLFFDVAPRTSNNVSGGGVTVAQAPAGNANIHQYFWNGAGITINTTLAVAACSTGRLAFLKNDVDQNYYLATINGGGPYDYKVTQLINVGANVAVNHTYNVALARAKLSHEITGIVGPGTVDLTILLGNPDTAVGPGPFAYRNTTDIYVTTFAGSSTLAKTILSLTPAATPFILPGVSTFSLANYYVPMVYVGDPVGDNNTRQSTYFLLHLSTISNFQICGRWDYGQAYADWQNPTTPTMQMHLSTPTTGPDGTIHVPMVYRARSSTSLQAATSISGVEASQQFQFLATDALAIRDYIFGPDHGQPFEASGEMFIGGPECEMFNGSAITESGIPLITEVSTPTVSGGAGNIPPGNYQWMIVAEYTDDNGNLVRSPVSAPINIAAASFGGVSKSVSFGGTMLHTTRKAGIRFSVYRTVLINGIMTAEHYKVSNDLSPTLNDVNAVSWTFTDNMLNATASSGEKLYVDNGILDHFPAPPHHGGCATDSRVFLLGYDNAVWFSAPKTEGDAWWFNPFFRIPLPTDERTTKAVIFDHTLVVFCASSNIFAIPIGSLPDATGQGNFPTPVLLRFSNGCTGQATVTNDGIIYSAAQGGIWMLTTGFADNVYLGETLKDTIEPQTPVVTMCSDVSQRVYSVLNSDEMAVYDQVSGTWNVWLTPQGSGSFPVASCAYKGQFTYVDTNAGVYTYSPGNYGDGDGSIAIPLNLTIAAMHFGGIRNFLRVWNAQLQGEYLGPHSLLINATFYSDEYNTPPACSYSFTPANSTDPYIIELPPKIEELNAIQYIISETAQANSRGFAIEAMAFEVQVGPGLGRLPTGRRIQQT